MFMLLPLLIAGLLLVTAPAAGQIDTAAPEVDPNANISFPPPVYVLRGSVDIRGSANLANMTGYFLEYRPLNSDLTVSEEALWFPAVLPRAAAVLDDVLGAWDTTTTDDGLYEIRLTISLIDGTAFTSIVSPIRVENEPPPFVVIEPIIPEAGVAAVPTLDAAGGAGQQPPPQTEPTAVPSPEATADNRPRVTPSNFESINVRSGDGTNFPAFAALFRDQEAEILGISATGSGWFQIRLPNGQTGWVSPTVVQVLGDISGVARVQPPPPPAPTATPIPLPTFTAAAPIGNPNVNLVAGILQLNPSAPRCAENVQIGFDVANLGSAATTTSGRVTVTDFRVADNSVQGTTFGDFPVLQPNQTVRVNMNLTISTWYNEDHRLVLEIDQANTFGEANRSDNRREVVYRLDKGNCP
jgi:hypothetical protein